MSIVNVYITLLIAMDQPIRIDDSILEDELCYCIAKNNCAVLSEVLL